MCDICYLFGFRRKNLREGVRKTSVNGKGARISVIEDNTGSTSQETLWQKGTKWSRGRQSEGR
jgi:hypothetical protein